MKRLILGCGILALMLMLDGRQATANNYVQYDQGDYGLLQPPLSPTKNLYIDLVFWGWGGTINNWGSGPIDPDAKKVMDAVQEVANWLNTGGWVYDDDNPTPVFEGRAGFEPAVHYYGLSAVTPGLWVNDSLPIPSEYVMAQGGTSQPPVNSLFYPVVDLAQWYGSLGAANDFEGNPVDPSGLEPSSNRLVLVITKGTNGYVDPSTGHSDCGWHGWYNSQRGVPQPYGEVMSETITPNTQECLSHEIMEAMTDTFTFSGWTAVNHNQYWGWGYAQDEIGDECEGVGGPAGGEFTAITVDPPYSIPGILSTPWTSCQQVIPEQHAPLAAALELAPQNGSVDLELAYIDPNGHVHEMGWGYAGGAHSSPVDLGQPSDSPGPIVKATGKPGIAYSNFNGGESIFVKGSDGALWMQHNGAWTSLGGRIYGDPSVFLATIYGVRDDIYITALGLDDKIYLQDIENGIPTGWYGPISDWGPTQGTLFAGSPVGISRAPNTIDFFAVGEDTSLKWINWNISTGWSAPTTIVNGAGNADPIIQTPTVSVDTSGTMQLFGNGQFNMWQTSWSGSSWSSPEDFRFRYPYPQSQYDYGFQGSMASTSWAAGHFDAFAVSRAGELWWWHTDPTAWDDGAGYFGSTPLALVKTGGSYPATGDPLTISRNSGEVEVFYRITSGQLAHLTYLNGAWGAPEISLPPNAIR